MLIVALKPASEYVGGTLERLFTAIKDPVEKVGKLPYTALVVERAYYGLPLLVP
jgi:hypothetical protein